MPQKFGLLLIGDELLSGRRADKHLPKVIEMLTSKGLELSWMHCIGDEPEQITEELKWAFKRDDVVFSCGGIGSTPDDCTRQCAAEALGLELELHPAAKVLIVERAKEMAAEAGEEFKPDSVDMHTRLNMGVYPKGASIIPNPYNKIPGFSFKNIHFFPGFPVMAWPMMEWVLGQYYSEAFVTNCIKKERSIVVYGIGEARLTPLMESLEKKFDGIKVFSLPSVDNPTYGAHIELGVSGEAGLVERVFDVMLTELRKLPLRLGPELTLVGKEVGDRGA